MLHIVKSNDAKILTERLANDLSAYPCTPFQFDVVCAPDGVQERLKIDLAAFQNIFLGPVETPRGVAERIVSGFSDDKSDISEHGRDGLALAVAKSIKKRIDDPLFLSLRNYFGETVPDKKLLSFASVVGNLFGEYTIYRPQMLESWNNTTRDWQGILFQDVLSVLGDSHFGKKSLHAIACLAKGGFPRAPVPPRIYIYGISSFPPLLLQLFAAISAHSEVYLYVFSPSSEFFAYNNSDSPNSRLQEPLDDDSNELLRLFGRQAAGFQGALIDIAQQVPVVETDDFTEVFPVTILGQLQQSVMQNKPVQLSGTIDGDNTIQFHQCTSEAREIDELKNLLLDSIQSEKIGPNEILVMAPNINDYVAHIDSAFSDVSIPFAIADRTKSGVAGVMEAISQLLELIDGRLGLRTVFSLLNIGAVRKKFSLSLEDVKRCFLWCKEAKIRSCIDSAHRKKLGLVPCKENTWRFGLERLFLGVVMESSTLFSGVSPLSGFVGTEAQTLGRLSHFLETLFDFVTVCEEPKTVSQWCDELQQVVELIIDTENEAEQLVGVRTTLERIRSSAKSADFDNRIDFNGFRFLLKGKFSPTWFQSGGTLGVRFSSFRFLRGERYKLVVVLGMGEGKFPIELRKPSFDLVSAHPQAQDKDDKHDGYQMFLDSLLGASQRYAIFFSCESGAPENFNSMCIPARELKNSVERSLSAVPAAPPASGSSEAAVEKFSKHCLFVHPANAFDPVYFDEEFPKFFSYSDTDFFAAQSPRRGVEQQAVEVIGRSGSRTENVNFCAPPKDIVTLSIAEFVRFWKNPVRFYLQSQVGMVFPANEENPTDDVPTSLGGLDEWVVGKTIVEGVLQQKSIEEMQQLVQSLGLAPAGNLGAYFSKKTYHRALKIANEAKHIMSLHTVENRDVDMVLSAPAGQLRLLGSLENVFDQTLLDFSYSSLKPSRLLTHWLKHLLFVNLDGSSGNLKSVVVGRKGNDGERLQFVASGDEDNKALKRVAQFTLLGLSSPLPFFPEFSATYAQRSQKLDELAQQSFLLKAINDLEQQLRDDGTPEVRALPEMNLKADNGSQFHLLATDVMNPLFKNVQKKVLK